MLPALSVVEVSYFGRELSPWQNAPALIGEGRFGEARAFLGLGFSMQESWVCGDHLARPSDVFSSHQDRSRFFS